MKSKAFDIKCPDCADRLRFTISQRLDTRGKLVEPRWPATAMVRCPACHGVATVAVLAVNAAPDDPDVTVTRFVKLTRG